MARALTIAAARCVVFTGGGTAGHVFPGLAVAAELARRWDGRIVWIGSRGGPERALVEAAGIAFRSIPAGKLRRYRSLENLTDAFRIVGGFAASLRVLAAERPALLFSKGGFVSVPPVIAARLLGIPAFNIAPVKPLKPPSFTVTPTSNLPSTSVNWTDTPLDDWAPPKARDASCAPMPTVILKRALPSAILYWKSAIPMCGPVIVSGPAVSGLVPSAAVAAPSWIVTAFVMLARVPMFQVMVLPLGAPTGVELT